MTPALSALQSYDAGSSVSQTSLSYAVSTELLSQPGTCFKVWLCRRRSQEKICFATLLFQDI